MAQAARLSLRRQKELKLLLSDPPHGASFPLLCAAGDAAHSSSSSLTAIDAESGLFWSSLKKTKMSSREQVRAYHILIKHQGSRRKASWKDPEDRVISNTTKEAAITQLESIRETSSSATPNSGASLESSLIAAPPNAAAISLFHVLQKKCHFVEAVTFMESSSHTWHSCSSFMSTHNWWHVKMKIHRSTHNWWHVALCYLEAILHSKKFLKSKTSISLWS